MSERTEVRVLIGEDALYVGTDSSTGSLEDPQATGAAGRGLASDYLAVLLDSYHDHLTAFRFRVNPAAPTTTPRSIRAATRISPGIPSGR